MTISKDLFSKMEFAKFFDLSKLSKERLDLLKKTNELFPKIFTLKEFFLDDIIKELQEWDMLIFIGTKSIIKVKGIDARILDMFVRIGVATDGKVCAIDGSFLEMAQRYRPNFKMPE
ncbi:MAG: hypothetical protein ACTSO9_06875 [Candidatus Helarchaeota archaeon]